MTTTKERTSSIPIKISQITHGMWAAQALKSGLELKVFDQLENGAKEAIAIASASKSEKHAMEALLDAIVAIGLLQKTANKYSLTDESRTYLLSRSPLFVGDYVQMTQEAEKIWQQLTEVVRCGQPVKQVNDEKEAQEFFPALAEKIFPMNFAIAERVVEELKVSQLSSAKVLDVAAGAGTWSIPMAIANQGVHVDALDFPATLAVTEKFATKYGVAARYQYIAGNWRDVKWNKSNYDLVILGHILHSEGKKLSSELIKQCFEAIKPGGQLVIAEFIANDERNAPPFAMLFGINMLINTTEGCVFTQSELQDMLTSAGFVEPYRMPIEEMPYSPIMIACKPTH